MQERPQRHGSWFIQDSNTKCTVSIAPLVDSQTMGKNLMLWMSCYDVPHNHDGAHIIVAGEEENLMVNKGWKIEEPKEERRRRRGRETLSTMEALLQTYASSDSESDSEREGASPKAKKGRFTPEKGSLPLPPPPSDLLNPSNSVCLSNADPHMGRTRSFPHVEGNFALHVYIPVPLSSIAKRQMEPLMKKASFLDPDLQSIEVEFPAPRNGNENSLNELKLAKEYHISLSRTVPIRIHQIETILRMLKHKFSSQKRFWMEFGRWDFFVNDDRTRSFLALEIPPSKGSSEIQRPIQIVNEVFRLHNLPTFYENPRLHISVAWLLGDASSRLKAVAEELNTQAESNNSAAIWSFLFSSIDCKIGKQIYPIWRAT